MWIWRDILPALQETIRPTLIPGLGRSPGVGNGKPLQYSCLENPMDRRAWQAIVHGVAKSQTWLSNIYTFTFQSITLAETILKTIKIDETMILKTLKIGNREQWSLRDGNQMRRTQQLLQFTACSRYQMLEQRKEARWSLISLLKYKW